MSFYVAPRVWKQVSHWQVLLEKLGSFESDPMPGRPLNVIQVWRVSLLCFSYLIWKTEGRLRKDSPHSAPLCIHSGMTRWSPGFPCSLINDSPWSNCFIWFVQGSMTADTGGVSVLPKMPTLYWAANKYLLNEQMNSWTNESQRR
jgi:hypothetical protein